ncbi:MAG: hypothetical protein ABIY47_01095 [Opitutaceae bacterium]
MNTSAGEDLGTGIILLAKQVLRMDRLRRMTRRNCPSTRWPAPKSRPRGSSVIEPDSLGLVTDRSKPGWDWLRYLADRKSRF